jgi:hypothetical protein
MSPAEYRAYSDAAKAKGMRLADYIRNLLRAAQDGQLDLDKAAAIGVIREKTRELAEAVGKL